MEYGGQPALEHGSSRFGRWLRYRRVRVAVWIAVAEGILIVLHAISWWAAIVIAALVLVSWFGFAHRIRNDTVRQAGWILAVSQALVALVPIFVVIVGTLALIVVGLLAVLALVLLFSSRD
jgi:hypothetical protein